MSPASDSPDRPFPPIPNDEQRRLAALRATGLLDSPAEDAFDDLVALAARLLNATSSLVNLVDVDRQWAKAAVAEPHGNVVPRQDSFCAHTIADPSRPLIVEDTRRDPRFATNPLVAEGLIFYAGVPLTTHEGFALGALCIVDDHPRTLTPDELTTLTVLANAATAQIELRREHAAAQRAADEMRELFERAPDAVVEMDATGCITGWNARAEALFGWSREEALGLSVGGLIVPAGLRDRHYAGLSGYRDGGAAPVLDGPALELPGLHRDGHEIPIELTVAQLGDLALDPSAVRFVSFIRDVSERHALEVEREAERRNVATIASVARRLARATALADVETEICAAVQDVTGADGVQLWRPHAEGGLVAGAAAGAPTGLRVTPGEPSCTIAAIDAGETIFVPDVHADERISSRMATVLGAASAVFVPVHAGDSPVAVVAVFWRKPLPELPVQTDALLELLSAEAAVALERTGLIARLETLSRTDGLTGLANRRMLDDEAAREVARAHRSDEPLSVVMLDLDHFKAFNDEHGHQSGDRLLKETASAWRSLMRASDLLARYGGEEFVLVLPTCPGHEALALAARLRDAMPLQQSCSAGVAQLREGETAAELVARADRLLYSAKAAGRDCAVIDED